MEELKSVGAKGVQVETLNERFERQFSESHADNYFYLKRDLDLWCISPSDDGRFDYGVFDRRDDRLIMVINLYDEDDLDVVLEDDPNFWMCEHDKQHAYIDMRKKEQLKGLKTLGLFKGDISEIADLSWDELKERYKRSPFVIIESVQFNHMIADLERIIWELLDGECWKENRETEEYEIDQQMVDEGYFTGIYEGKFEEYLNDVLYATRTQPFPYPHYPDKEIMSSWVSLKSMPTQGQSIAKNTRAGDTVVAHFHSSIWHDHRDGELSPYDAWQDVDIIWEVIQNRVIFQRNLTLPKILQGLNVTKKAPKVSVFSPGRAKIIAAKYLSNFDTVFDPFSGYSGRMLGVVSLGKKYIGQDISMAHVNESNQMIKWFHNLNLTFNATVTQADTTKTAGTYPCLFTCSPYALKEQWQDVPAVPLTCDDWIDICLKNFVCSRYVFVVDTTEKYKPYATDVIGNRSHFGKNTELVIVMDREGDTFRPVAKSIFDE